MSRRQELCRDFQRGNCRYGARCKFLHELPQQQQQQQQQQRNQQQQQQQKPQQQPRYQQQRNQFGSGGNYYNVLGNSNSNNANARQTQIQSSAGKEHRCNDPRICKEQIKVDMANEHPVFWRLTCYAHYKCLPNDIVGDVSPEELRALAYEGAKQGRSLKDVVERERLMMAAKGAEFDALLRNPYKGPAQSALGFQSSSSFTSSPFLSPPAAKSSPFAPFGQPANMSSPGPPQAFAQPPFGGAPTTTTATAFNFNQPSGDVNFGKQAARLSNGSPSPFGQQANPFQQSPFGSTASPALQNPFGGAAVSPAPQNPFPSPQGQTMVMNQNAFQSPSPFGAATRTNFPPNQSQSGFPTLASPGFNAPVVTPVLNPTATAAQTTPSNTLSNTPSSTPLQVAPAKSQDKEIWFKDVWKIGEIPEEEPPAEVRF